MNDKIIGILGGMGPEATANLYMKIIKATQVKKDQDHFRVIIDSNAKIPDRTSAILGQGISPVPAMVETGKNLERAGAEVALIPCNTAHYFIEEVQSQLSIPIINALEELNHYIKKNYADVRRVGLLSTSGTIKTGLYPTYLTDLDVLYPDDNTQENKVMEAIYGEDGIKRGNSGEKPRELLREASNELIQRGAQLIIAGCTEIGLALKSHHISTPLLDPMDVVAEVITQ